MGKKGGRNVKKPKQVKMGVKPVGKGYDRPRGG